MDDEAGTSGGAEEGQHWQQHNRQPNQEQETKNKNIRTYIKGYDDTAIFSKKMRFPLYDSLLAKAVHIGHLLDGHWAIDGRVAPVNLASAASK